MNNEPTSALRSATERWLSTGPHEHVLAVGDPARALLRTDGGQPLAARIVAVQSPAPPLCDWLARLPAASRFCAAVLSRVSENLSDEDAAVVLSRVRDLHAARVLLLTPSRGAIRADLLALGMERVHTGDGGEHALYAFDLGHYKRTPDWLSARHWAHPELWGKYRW